MLVLWISLPLVCGWQLLTPNDAFIQKARQEIDSFHRILFPDNFPSASHTSKEILLAKGAKESGDEDKNKATKSSEGVKSETGKSTSHEKESTNKGHANKENLMKKYGEEAGKKGKTHSESNHEDEHHKSSGGGKTGGFRDRLLHKKGNYEKGYRDKYHLDEVKKHDRFWSAHDSLDQYHKFGQHGSQYYKKHQGQAKEQDKTGKEQESSQGKKGETGGGKHQSEHKGHESQSGAESKYEHKEEYQKNK